MKRHIFLIPAILILAACSDNAADGPMSLTPDYSDITIPCNIAPLNFRVNGASDFTVSVEGSNGSYEFKGRRGLVSFGLGKWHSMLETEKGNTLNVCVKASASGKEPFERKFTWTVSPDSIDAYLSYRLIEPAYEVWNEIQIEERCLEDFSTRLLADNASIDQSCMNCHVTNGNGTSFMHIRGSRGGTVLNRNGQVSKISTATDRTGGGVYGDISPDGRYGVFTTADITFAIHSRTDMRMEVYDKRSDLVVIDFDNLTAADSPATSGSEYQETFPCFSANGHIIYFCRAQSFQQPDSTASMHYDIAAVQFDPETGKMGDTVKTLIRGGENLSFSHLKVSPDGRWLMATVATYGTFPVWHPESELWLIDLKEHSVDIMPETNAYGADTYHSWSRNSRWVVFASKRDDMVYGRPYIVHIDGQGHAGKAFVLPQRDPVMYTSTMKSFNMPELYPAREDYGSRSISRLYDSSDIRPVIYR